MAKKLKIGVFGGGRGDAMIRVLLHHPDAELVAVCDRYEPLLDKVRARAAAVGAQVACYPDFESFLKHPGMDAVVLANYATEHAVYAIRCMEAGKHVLSECLPCETMAQAVALVECVEKTGLVYAFAENCCYMSHTFDMWRRYRMGDIGTAVYGEGEYVHDCAPIWADITYGERTHWRNRMHANFYCTHSIGPLLTITGLKPVQVVGFETNPPEDLIRQGSIRGSGIEIITMENGAVFKSLHGDLKREGANPWNFVVYGTKGVMESGRLPENRTANVYREGERMGEGAWERYDAETLIAAEQRKLSDAPGHSGSDFYAVHFFIEKILGRPDGAYSIDVYTAVSMGICGLLAYRSTLNGNRPVRVPDLSDPAQRDAYRDDCACTTPEVAGSQLLPVTSRTEYLRELPDAVYEDVRRVWRERKQ